MPDNVSIAPLLTPKRKAVILGLPLVALNAQELASQCSVWISSGKPAHITLGTLPLAIACERDVLLQNCLTEAEAVLCGSAALAWAAGHMGAPQPEVFTGSAIVEILSAAAAAHGWQIALLGPESDDLTATAKKLQRLHPALKSPLCFVGPLGDTAADRERIRTARVDLLFVGLPPDTETDWIYRQLPWLNVPLIVGVGDGLAVFSGRIASAPQPLARRWLGWTYSLARHPWSRIPLYTMQLVFAVRALRRERRALRFPSAQIAASTACALPQEIVMCIWTGRVELSSLEKLPVAEVPRKASGLILDLSGVTFMDSSGLGHLIHYYRRAKAIGAGFVLLAPSPGVRALFSATKLDRLFAIASTATEAAGLCQTQTPRLLPSTDQASPGELVLCCQGDMTAPRLDAASRWLSNEWKAHPGSHHLSLDFSRVQLMDSSGIGWLLQARRLALERKGDFSILHAHGQPLALLTQTHLLHTLSVS